MKRGNAGWGDELMAREASGSGRRISRTWALAGAATGALMVGALIMPTTVAAAEDDVVVASSVTAPSVSASSNCVGADAWSATFVISSNAGDSGSWQLNGGAYQSTAANFVIDETHSLSDSTSALSATVSFDGGAQGRPVAASVDRPDACISAPPPPVPDVEAETVSQLADENVVESVAPVPTVFASSNCSGADAWLATFVISSNAANGASWQLNDGEFQSTATDFVVEETHGMEDASASLSANVSFQGGAQGVAVAAAVDRPEACISAPAPTLAPAETVPAVEVFGPVAVLAPASAATPTPDLAQTLPATGNETTILALLALASLGAGMLLVGASRRNPSNETNRV
jgi:LPXTG-motif cell wall-anchored protein